MEAALNERETEIGRLKNDIAQINAEWSNRLRISEHETIAKKTAELEEKYNEKKQNLENDYKARLGDLEAGIERMRQDLCGSYKAQQDALLFEKQQGEEIVKRREAECRSRMTHLDEREAALSGHEEIIKAKYEQMLHDRLVEHENNLQNIRERFEKEISQRRMALDAEYSLMEQQIKTEYNEKLESEKRDMLNMKEMLEKTWNCEKARLEEELAGRVNEAESARTKVYAFKAMADELEQKLANEESAHRQGIISARREIEENYSRKFAEEFAQEKQRMKEEAEFSKTRAKELESQIKELSHNYHKLHNERESKRLEMEVQHTERINKLLDEMRSKDEKISKLHEEIIMQDNILADKLQAYEHDVISKKIAQLEEEYAGRRADLEAGIRNKQDEFAKEQANSKEQFYETLKKELHDFEEDAAARQKISEGNWGVQKKRFESELNYREQEICRLHEKVRGLEESFFGKTQEGTKALLEKFQTWESSYAEGVKAIEQHQRRLEEEWLERRERLEGDYQKLKTELYVRAEAQIQAAEKDRLQHEKAMENAGETEISRLKEELLRREEQMKITHKTIAGLEDSLVKQKQESSRALAERMAEQENAYRKAIEDFQHQQRQIDDSAVKRMAELEGEYAARFKQLEEIMDGRKRVFEGKEKVLEKEKDGLLSAMERRRVELDNMDAALNARAGAFEDSIRAREEEWEKKEEEMRLREQEWNEHKRVLQTSYEAKLTEIEKLKDELNKTILEYKKRKTAG